MKLSYMIIGFSLSVLPSTMAMAQKSAVPPDESNKEGVLEWLFITSSGEPLSSEPSITIERRLDGNLHSPTKRSRSAVLKYGTYTVRVQYSGAYPVDKTVTVDKPSQSVVICLFTSPIELPWDGNLIRGKISDKSKQRNCRWIRLMSPFASGEFAETKASESGYFALHNVRAGKYWVFTIGNNGVCEIAESVVLLGEPIRDLDLQWQSPPH